MKANKWFALSGIVLLSSCSTFEQEKKVYDLEHDNELIVHLKDTETNKEVGTVTITPYIQNGERKGLIFTPHLYNLPGPSSHGFHVHINPSCDDKGMAAGGHWDPHSTNSHLGPYNDKGHKGDLPVLVVDTDGSATKPILAPKIQSLEELDGLSLMVHEGSDNYSDDPDALGGGGNRMWCGVISDLTTSSETSLKRCCLINY